jgi:hypothetical protein
MVANTGKGRTLKLEEQYDFEAPHLERGCTTLFSGI